MAFKQRHSKFRHVFSNGTKKDACYDNIRISKSPWDSNKCDVNGKFLAVILESQGGGSFVVVPLNKTGRLDINYPKVSGHKNPILDLAFDPFNDNIIATASEDCTVKIWEIPDGGFPDNTESFAVDLARHERKVGALAWHPTAANVLASGGADGLIVIWNTENGEIMQEIDEMHPDLIYCLSWSYNGSLIASSCKDKKVRVIDPRACSLISEGQCHSGSKPTRVTFCGTLNYVFTTGFSRTNERQYGLFKQNDIGNALACETIDTGSGTMFCYYDEDTKMVYAIGKGDGQIRYYEILTDSPYVSFLNIYQNSAPQLGCGFMPKRHLHHQDCEVARIYKLHNKGYVEPLPMIVPRKSDMFQKDIFPPCVAGVPSLTADEWIGGANKPPVLITITKDGFGGEVAGQTMTAVASAVPAGKLSKQSSHSSTGSLGRSDRDSSPTPVLTSSGNFGEPGNKQLEEQNQKLRAEVDQLRNETQRLKSQLKEKEEILRQIKKLVQ